MRALENAGRAAVATAPVYCSRIDPNDPVPRLIVAVALVLLGIAIVVGVALVVTP